MALPQNRQFLPLLRAVTKGDHAKVANLISQHPDSLTATISVRSKKPIHIAVRGSHKTIAIVDNLVRLMSADQLGSATDDDGLTALHEAAIIGNVPAAKLLVSKNPNLPFAKDAQNRVPLYWAVQCGHKKMATYMLGLTAKPSVGHRNPFADNTSGVELLCLLIAAEFYDLALEVVHCHPQLSILATSTGETPLRMLAKHANSFPNGFQISQRLSTFHHIIYYCVYIKPEKCSNHGMGDIENSKFSSKLNLLFPLWTLNILKGWHKFQEQSWKALGKIVPSIKDIAAQKLKHYEALKLAKCLCVEAEGLNFSEVSKIFGGAIHMGLKNGNIDMVRLIINTIPYAIWFCDENSRDPFQAAVLYRRENIFNLLYHTSDRGCLTMHNLDIDGNNILHLAGLRAPYHEFDCSFGAALEMQHELLWFQAVEEVVQPSFKEALNNDKKTPFMVFTEEHRELAKQGEKWIKATANYCTVVATLIATVTFAAQITIPGGNNNDGLPNLIHKTAFPLFGFLNACSLITSTASIAVFLSIVTASCVQIDFRQYLPYTLVVGFLTLFSSITTMLLAFSCTLLLLLVGQYEHDWGIISVFTTLSCLPVLLFVSFQFPILKCTIRYTFGSGILNSKGWIGIGRS